VPDEADSNTAPPSDPSAVLLVKVQSLRVNGEFKLQIAPPSPPAPPATLFVKLQSFTVKVEDDALQIAPPVPLAPSATLLVNVQLASASVDDESL
jgi:hypothetical protein